MILGGISDRDLSLVHYKPACLGHTNGSCVQKAMELNAGMHHVRVRYLAGPRNQQSFLFSAA
jgi:hypothetical protein